MIKTSLLRRSAPAILALVLVGCAPKRIPGTAIDDTDETRAILGVMEKYRSAIESKDVNGVMTLLDPSFKDDAGTSGPEDDLNYEALKQKLPDQFAQTEELKLDVTVKKITVNKNDTADVVYSYNTAYKLPKLSNKLLSDSELDQMTLKRVNGTWKIISGI